MQSYVPRTVQVLDSVNLRLDFVHFSIPLVWPYTVSNQISSKSEVNPVADCKTFLFSKYGAAFLEEYDLFVPDDDDDDDDDDEDDD